MTLEMKQKNENRSGMVKRNLTCRHQILYRQNRNPSSILLFQNTYEKEFLNASSATANSSPSAESDTAK